mmetsp:Transcript_25954/g.52911  ORF Transcript_25954/g.52911 Transcript_25954/m.52911 type:complete len:330 (+) Transcript_25954:213-1202(+)
MVQSGIRRKMDQLGSLLKLNNLHIESAFRLFIFANQQGVSKNRKIDTLCISCLYTICRQNKTPHLLIDFSEITQIRANKIGVDFLKFRKYLNLTLPVTDPSLFVHRFASRLQLGSKTSSIILSSLRLIARMKRDWISTGRRPSGLCGAALLLASHMHGVKKSQKEISKIVRIGNIVLGSRLKEIGDTSINFLTIQEINLGGGDDGNKDSLTDFYFKNRFQPPSRKDSIERTPKKLPGKKKDKKNLFSKTPRNLKKKDSQKENIRVKKNTEIQKIFKEDLLNCINSKFQIFVKETIWYQTNSNFFFSQSINARAQKERPFAFFGTTKSST